ncbi:hypothetical protein SERLA73DRAFT_184189 [Serpula lacrymans var. lacrymans S7.3]|uniref:Aprataxin and PNK-like factor PBZ domain-containing protein n=2 Tax=Serpula lacrymans var. lacrymans TaxID=341189 RepID=F8Q2Q9_SERL3|nr:uncharacterized protein SERLADRAFT_471746 [Serpula lacrymans var. lacrymans S7.9]EGN97470.1 hypothetical protein SERLA73DRAFT_184189 [Serpula lacrymans var. lacrymans S7.3]EGO23064.1 hypothetical protein SERLADRAFT_471746 [Serpula lacrymans var. lacrymans S7.9]
MSTEPLQLGYLNDDGPYEKFLTGPLKELYTERQVTNEPYGKDLEKLILDRVNGENDKCRQCTSDYQWLPGIKQGVNLYNETNWDYLRGYIIADLQFHVPGKVLQNQSDKQLNQTLRNIDYAILMDEMFDSKKDPYLNLSKQDWVCYDCLTELFRDTVLRWWLNRKRRDGVTIKEDCQYGYDCSQQTYSRGLEHAMRFNHLCEPTQREQGSQGAY